MNRIRLIVKVPHTSQTAPEAWTDATYYKTFDIDVPDAVYESLKHDATVVGGHRIEDESK